MSGAYFKFASSKSRPVNPFVVGQQVKYWALSNGHIGSAKFLPATVERLYPSTCVIRFMLNGVETERRVRIENLQALKPTDKVAA